jgi:hypothetical protein
MGQQDKRNKRTPIILACLACALSLVVGCERAIITTHQVTLADHAELKSTSATQTLIVKQNAAGEPLEYAMDVTSVYCLDDQCEIIAVRVFWDPLGVYQRYEIPAGKNLTKNDHTAFNVKDHEKLHRLLQDAQSQIKNVKPEAILQALQTKQSPSSENTPAQPFAWRNPEYNVNNAKGKTAAIANPAAKPNTKLDAVSTPTPIDLKAIVVPGAAYTSLTLWNWAHGQVPNHIRTITRKTASHTQLLNWLNDKQPARVRFALNALTHRRFFDDATVTAVLKRCQQQDDDWIKPAWRFLMRATADTTGASNIDYSTRQVRLNIYTTLLTSGTSQQRAFLLEQLDKEKHIPANWYASLVPLLGQFKSYYEVHLFLNVLSARKVQTPQVITAVAEQLNHTNSFIARRAYSFLTQLPASTQPAAAMSNYRNAVNTESGAP